LKKILLITVCTFFLSCLFAQDFWIKQPSSPTTKNLRKILFVDTLYGWASGDSGTIINTTNGGQNWTVQNSGITAYNIDDIFFLNRRLGWALSNDYLFFGTKMLKTTNGGLNWQLSVFPDTTQVFYTIFFLDSLTGFMGGYTGTIYKTTNGGNNWINCYIDSNYCPYLYLFPKLNFSFLNAQTGFVCGGHLDIQGMIWRTTDAGLNWLTYCVTPEPVLRIKSLYPNKIIATGGDFEYNGVTTQSIDSGNTWMYDLIGPTDSTTYLGIGYSLAFRTPSELWIPLGYSLSWGVNLDSGSKIGYWYQIPTPDSSAIYDAIFVNQTFGYACGDNGVLLKYNPAIIGIHGNSELVPNRYKLYQNYPNPFNPVTTISYFVNTKSTINIRVYDLLGREIRFISEGVKPAGLYKTIFSSKGLASGVYFYVMEATPLDINEKVFTESKKMVILK